MGGSRVRPGRRRSCNSCPQLRGGRSLTIDPGPCQCRRSPPSVTVLDRRDRHNGNVTVGLRPARRPHRRSGGRRTAFRVRLTVATAGVQVQVYLWPQAHVGRAAPPAGPPSSSDNQPPARPGPGNSKDNRTAKQNLGNRFLLCHTSGKSNSRIDITKLSKIIV